MSRPRAEINIKRCKRLKQLIDETGIKQNQLAADTGISQQSISAMVQEKANVTDTTIEIITKKFPQYSAEWLSGYSDYKNTTERFAAAVSRACDEGELLLTGLNAFAQLANYHISANFPQSVNGRIAIEGAINAVKRAYTITHDGTSIQLSVDEMNAFENEVLDFITLQFAHLFKRKEAADNG